MVGVCLKSFVRLAARVAERASHVAVERFGKLAKFFFCPLSNSWDVMGSQGMLSHRYWEIADMKGTKLWFCYFEWNNGPTRLHWMVVKNPSILGFEDIPQILPPQCKFYIVEGSVQRPSKRKVSSRTAGARPFIVGSMATKWAQRSLMTTRFLSAPVPCFTPDDTPQMRRSQLSFCWGSRWSSYFRWGTDRGRSFLDEKAACPNAHRNKGRGQVAFTKGCLSSSRRMGKMRHPWNKLTWSGMNPLTHLAAWTDEKEIYFFLHFWEDVIHGHEGAFWSTMPVLGTENSVHMLDEGEFQVVRKGPMGSLLGCHLGSEDR